MDIATAKACNFETFIDVECDGDVWHRCCLRLLPNIVAQRYISVLIIITMLK